LSTKPVEALGQTFYVEHGFHGEWTFQTMTKPIPNSLVQLFI
jgi:hypothetical protein